MWQLERGRGDDVRVLNLADDDDTVEATDAVDVAKSVQHKVLIGLHIAGVDLYLEIEVARGIVALGNLLDILDRIHKLLDKVVRMLLEPDVAKHYDAVAELLVVDHGRVPLNEAVALEPFLPLESWRDGKADLGGELLHRLARVLLKEAQEFAVYLVKFVL